MKYMAQPGAPPAAWQGPLFKEHQAKTNSTIRLEHRNSDTPHADCIVTANLKDFPEDALAPFGIQVIHPDEFLIAQMDLDPLIVLAAFKEQRARLKNPAYTPSAFADALERNALVLTAQRLREAAALI